MPKANPLKPCRDEELRAGLDYALREYQFELHDGTLRAIFNRAQEKYERGERFLTAAHYESRQLRIDRTELEVMVAAIAEMGRYRKAHPAPSTVVYHDFTALREGGPTPADRVVLQHDGAVTKESAAVLDLGALRPIEARRRAKLYGGGPE